MHASLNECIDRDYEHVAKELKDIKIALDHSTIVAITDSNGVITYVNDHFCEISKYSRQELIGQTHRIINSGAHSAEYIENVWKTITNGSIWKGEFCNRAKDGQLYWVNTTIIPYVNQEGKPYQYVAIRNDITERKRVEDQIHYLAYHDELTGLPNKRFFTEVLNEIINCNHEGNELLAVMYLDLDRFKNINDSLGHSVGDQYLTRISQSIKQSLKEDDLLARLGGDEFAVLMKRSNKSKIECAVNHLLKSVDQPISVEGHDLYSTVSIGISLFPYHGANVDTLIKKADIAMYEAKSTGKNKFHFFDNDLDLKTLRKIEIEQKLRTAIMKKELSLVYQPKMNMKENRIIGMEALIRWKNDELGPVFPDEFIPIAEETGQIFAIGEWVLREACQQAKLWNEMGFKDLVMAVNLSVKQLYQPQIVEKVVNILKETNLDPSLLELEITENFSIGDNYKATAIFHELKKHGIKLSIDDFGTGYSALAYLKNYRVDTLKIDKTFIDDIIESSDTSIVETIIALAKQFGLNVIAEGVETKEQVDFLINHTCFEAQGYLYSKPLSSEGFFHFLQQNWFSK